MPDTYLRASERRTGPPAANARCPAAPARAAARASPSNGGYSSPTYASAPRLSVRQNVVSRSDREAGDSKGRLRDPDKTAHRHVAEDGPSYRQAPYDAARELSDRYARDGRC